MNVHITPQFSIEVPEDKNIRLVCYSTPVSEEVARETIIRVYKRRILDEKYPVSMDGDNYERALYESRMPESEVVEQLEKDYRELGWAKVLSKIYYYSYSSLPYDEPHLEEYDWSYLKIASGDCDWKNGSFNATEVSRSDPSPQPRDDFWL